MRTQAFALFFTNRTQRQRQQNLLAQNVFEQQTFSLIIPDLGLNRGHRELFASGVRTLRTIEQIKLLHQLVFYRFQAPCTCKFHMSLKTAGNAYIVDQLVLAVLLAHQLSPACGVYLSTLPDLRAEIDHSRPNPLVKIDRMNLQLANLNEHGNLRAPSKARTAQAAEAH